MALYLLENFLRPLNGLSICTPTGGERSLPGGRDRLAPPTDLVTEDLSTMLTLIKAFARDEAGAAATEYAFLLVFIAMAIVVGVASLGNGLNTLFSGVGSYVSSLGANLP
jgi:Flp pilus assembly pilin Flp